MVNIELNDHSAEDAKEIEKLRKMGVPEDVIQMGYDNTQKMRKAWIPVREKLPQRGGKYLITQIVAGNSSVAIAEYFRERTLDAFSLCWNGVGFYEWDEKHESYYMCNATAWQPLPEPYKE